MVNSFKEQWKTQLESHQGSVNVIVQQTVQEQLRKHRSEENEQVRHNQPKKDVMDVTAAELVKMTLEGAKETFEKMAQEAKEAEATNREQVDLINELKQEIRGLQQERDRQGLGIERAGREESSSPTTQAQHELELEEKEREVAEMRKRFEYQHIDADYQGVPAKVDTNLQEARTQFREKKQKGAEEASKK